MPLTSLEFPPGVDRNGTKYEARGRWFDAQLVRWVEGTLQPVGGWEPLQTSSDAVDLEEPVHGMFAWQDNGGNARLALGTKDQVWAFSGGVLTEITPDGFTPGVDDATILNDAYGDGAYGAGIYGQGDLSQASVAPAQTWHFDNFGEFLVAVATSDGTLYSWDLEGTNDLTEMSSVAPGDNTGVVVTPERFVVALGADGDPRKVRWSDQESMTTWGPTATNQAGDFILPGGGTILLGRRARAETLLWTTQSLFAMRFIGGTLVYSFEQVGDNCGPISPKAVAMVDGGRAFWMGAESFFLYNGVAQPIPSSVSDYVFNDINRVQASKFHAVPAPAFNEVWWYYCSAGSAEIDRYVVYNYAEQHWSIGELNRTAGVPRGVFSFPLAADRHGAVYEHERGDTYLDIEGSALTPFAESGPFQIGEGDRLAFVRRLISDENTLGEVQARLYTAAYPTAPETEHGPYTLANPTDVRISGRQVRMRVEQVSPEWRVGTMRLDVVPGEQR